MCEHNKIYSPIKLINYMALIKILKLKDKTHNWEPKRALDVRHN